MQIRATNFTPRLTEVEVDTTLLFDMFRYMPTFMPLILIVWIANQHLQARRRAEEMFRSFDFKDLPPPPKPAIKTTRCRYCGTKGNGDTCNSCGAPSH